MNIHQNKYVTTQKTNNRPLSNQTMLEHITSPAAQVIQLQSITSFANCPISTLNIPGIEHHITQAYVDANAPERHVITFGQNPTDNQTKVYDITKIITPICAMIGNHVSQVLRGGTTWRNGAADSNNKLNEFMIVYSWPKLGVIMEQEFNKQANGYLRHAFINDSQTGYREYLSNGAYALQNTQPAIRNNDIYTALPTYTNNPPNNNRPYINLRDKTLVPTDPLPIARGTTSFSDNHGNLAKNTIANAVSGKDGEAADALSMALVEAARFNFLKKYINEIKTSTWLIFGNYGITVGTLFSNFSNIVRENGLSNNMNDGWEFYGIKPRHVVNWLLRNHSNASVHDKPAIESNSNADFIKVS